MKNLFAFTTGLLAGMILTSTMFCGQACKNGKYEQYVNSLCGL